MAAVDAQALREYARVDDTDEDAILVRLSRSAEAYLRNAGILQGNSDPDLYELAVCGITLHLYDHRDAGEGAAPDFAPGLERIIRQLKFSAVVLDAASNLDAEEAT